MRWEVGDFKVNFFLITFQLSEKLRPKACAQFMGNIQLKRTPFFQIRLISLSFSSADCPAERNFFSILHRFTEECDVNQDR